MKKVLSLLLVLVLALGMSTVAFAAKINDHDNDWTFGGDSFNDDAVPGEKWAFDIANSVLIYDDALKTVAADSTLITKTEMSKVKVMTRIAKGSKLFKAELKYTSNKAPYVQIEFIDPFVSNNTDGQDFEFTIFLSIDNTRFDEYGLTITGNLNNKSIEEIWADTDYINLEGGRIGTCEEYAKKVEYYLGNGISVWGKAFKGKKYYGYSDAEATDAQAEIMDKYNLDAVYNVKHVGLAAICDYVLLEGLDKDTFVYDGDLKLLGKGNDKLAFASVYYLSSKALDIADDEPDDEDDVDAPELPADSGGDSDAVIGANDNPSTGA